MRAVGLRWGEGEREMAWERKARVTRARVKIARVKSKSKEGESKRARVKRRVLYTESEKKEA